MKLASSLCILLSLAFFETCTSSPVPKAIEDVAGFVLYRNNGGILEYLLLQKRDELDDWSPPKGKMDPGENEQIAAIRETLEETGFWEEDFVQIIHKRFYFEYETNDGDEKKVTLFPAKLTNSRKEVDIDPNEHASFQWLDYASAQLQVKRQYRDALIAAHNYIRSIERL